MRRFGHKKVAAIVVVGAMVLGGAGVAFAYFTSTGTGTGSGAVGTAGNNISVTGTETTPLFPGGPGGTVTFTAANGVAVPEQLSTIHLVSVAADATHVTAGCTTALGVFTMADVNVAVADGAIAAHATNQSVPEAGTLLMTDTGTNQNACEGATLTLTFTTS